ncbi:MAG: FxsA family protein [Pseudomonadota bacterium]
MRLGFLLIFIAVPLAELALLIKLGEIIGLWPTLALIVTTAVVGTALLRQQGLRTLNKVTQSVNAGEAPVIPMVEGVLLLIAGAFLLTPGVLTDVVGGLLLLPPLRALLAKRAIAFAVSKGMVHVTTGGGRPHPGSASGTGRQPGRDDGTASGTDQQDAPSGPGPVIDGDFERLDEKTIDPKRRR